MKSVFFTLMLIESNIEQSNSEFYLQIDICYGAGHLKIKPGEYEYDISDNQTLIFHRLDSVGNCTFSILEDGIKAMSGFYFSDSVLMSSMLTSRSIDDDSFVISELHYYDLKRDGIWHYFSKEGTIIRSEKYHTGALYEVSSFSGFSED
jgi:hypothetical protein